MSKQFAPTPEQYRDLASDLVSETDTSLDTENAPVRPGDNGAHVQAWIWVPDEIIADIKKEQAYSAAEDNNPWDPALAAIPDLPEDDQERYEAIERFYGLEE